jgi:hypothetical protein
LSLRSFGAERHENSAWVRGFVRKMPENVDELFAQGVSYPLQHLTKSATIRTEEVSVDYEGQGARWGIGPTHVVAVTVNWPHKQMLSAHRVHRGCQSVGLVDFMESYPVETSAHY